MTTEKQTPEASTDLLTTFGRQHRRMGELWERYQGKGWPDKESDEFCALRDEREPATRRKLLVTLASAQAQRAAQPAEPADMFEALPAGRDHSPGCNISCGMPAQGCSCGIADDMERATKKDHEIAALVNEVTKIAREFGQTEQLRERLARVLVPVLKPQPVERGFCCYGGPEKERTCWSCASWRPADVTPAQPVAEQSLRR